MDPKLPNLPTTSIHTPIPPLKPKQEGKLDDHQVSVSRTTSKGLKNSIFIPTQSERQASENLQKKKFTTLEKKPLALSSSEEEKNIFKDTADKTKTFAGFWRSGSNKPNEIQQLKSMLDTYVDHVEAEASIQKKLLNQPNDPQLKKKLASIQEKKLNVFQELHTTWKKTQDSTTIKSLKEKNELEKLGIAFKRFENRQKIGQVLQDFENFMEIPQGLSPIVKKEQEVIAFIKEIMEADKVCPPNIKQELNKETNVASLAKLASLVKIAYPSLTEQINRISTLSQKAVRRELPENLKENYRQLDKLSEKALAINGATPKKSEQISQVRIEIQQLKDRVSESHIVLQSFGRSSLASPMLKENINKFTSEKVKILNDIQQTENYLNNIEQEIQPFSVQKEANFSLEGTDKRSRIMNEVYSTEKVFNEGLENLKKYKKYLENPQESSIFASLSAERKNIVLGELLELTAIVDKMVATKNISDKFLFDIKGGLSSIANSFISTEFSSFRTTGVLYDKAITMVAQSPELSNILNELQQKAFGRVEQKENFFSLLITPMQRLIRYSMLLTELRNTSNESDPVFIKDVMNKTVEYVSSIVKVFNSTVNMEKINQLVDNLFREKKS